VPAIDRSDLAFSKNGDYVLYINDLLDTSFKEYESLRQEVRTRVCGMEKDWVLHPLITASLEKKIGTPANKRTAQDIEREVIRALTFDGLFARGDLTVRVFPVASDILAVSIVLQVVNRDGRGTNQIPMVFSAINSEVNPRISAVF
jgi:hypothetical protein